MPTGRQHLVLAAVADHLLLTALHGLLHLAIPVIPNGWTAAFAVAVLYLFPVVGVGLVVADYEQVGAAVLLSASSEPPS